MFLYSNYIFNTKYTYGTINNYLIKSLYTKQLALYNYIHNRNRQRMTAKIGHIYEIICRITKSRYIGSTKYDIETRLYHHKGQYNSYKRGKGPYYSSFEVLKAGDYFIQLIESIEYQERYSLLEREGYWQRKLECVNLRIASRTTEQLRKEDPERWEQTRERNKENIKKWKRQRTNCFHCGKDLARGSIYIHKKRLHSNIPAAPPIPIKLMP